MKKWMMSWAALLSLPDFNRNSFRLLHRYWRRFRGRPFSELFLLLIEPVSLMLALSVGVGHWLNQVDGEPYQNFVVPAIAALCASFIPSWHAAQETFLEFRDVGGYWALLQTPMGAKDIAIGKIVWAASRGTATATLIIAFGWAMGWAEGKWLMVIPAVVWPGSILFAAWGVIFGTRTQNSSLLLAGNSLGFGFLAFWSDTLFPFSGWNTWTAAITQFSPIAHMVHPLRALCKGNIESGLFLDLAVTSLLACVFVNLAVRLFSKRVFPYDAEPVS